MSYYYYLLYPNTNIVNFSAYGHLNVKDFNPKCIDVCLVWCVSGLRHCCEVILDILVSTQLSTIHTLTTTRILDILFFIFEILH